MLGNSLSATGSRSSAKGRRDSGFEEGDGEGSMERYGAGLGSRYEWLSLDE